MTSAEYDRILSPFDRPEDAEAALGTEFELRTPEERLALMAAMGRRWNYGPFPEKWCARMMSLVDGKWVESEQFQCDRPMRGFA